MVRNPSFPQPNLLSADELFVDGVLLPLHRLRLHKNPDPPDDPEPPTSQPDPEPEPEPGRQISHTDSTTTTLSASKRWKDIFKKTTTTKKQEDKDRDKEKEKEKKRERRNQSGASSAELNINIWPFSRSRSAGNSGTRPKMFPGAPGTRKVSSAPCSRSNSAGESKSRKWPSSPGRTGVHLGRSSPVWQVRRGGGGSVLKSSYSEPVAVTRNGEKEEVTEPRRGKTSSDSGGAKARVLNLNVPMCIGYRQHLTCRSDDNSAIGVGVGVGGPTGKNSGGSGTHNNTINVGNGGNLFSFRSLFTKKVY